MANCRQMEGHAFHDHIKPSATTLRLVCRQSSTYNLHTIKVQYIVSRLLANLKECIPCRLLRLAQMLLLVQAHALCQQKYFSCRLHTSLTLLNNQQINNQSSPFQEILPSSSINNKIHFLPQGFASFSSFRGGSNFLHFKKLLSCC